MNPFARIFEKGPAYVGYLTAGAGGLEYSLASAKALIGGGVDILEVGVPFSDPVADGPTIAAAMDEALSHGVCLASIFDWIQDLKSTYPDVPIVLFSYLNPLLKFGLDAAFTKARSVGVDGLLLVDLPLEESAEYFQLAKTHHLAPVGLLAPATSKERIALISAHCQDSFLYYVCRNGITGTKSALPEDYAEHLALIKSATDTPVVSGFGIGERSLAKEACASADGFVVGSRFVKAMSEGISPQALMKLTQDIDPRVGEQE